MECLVPFLIVCVVLIAASAFASQAQERVERLNRAYKEVARRYGGRFVSGGWLSRPSVFFYHAGVKVVVDVHSVGGQRDGNFTQVHIVWPGPSFRCEIYPGRSLARYHLFRGMLDIEIGSPQFDRQYIINSDDSEQVRALLGPGVQLEIEKLRGFLGNGDIYVSIQRGLLQVKKLSLIDRPDLLLQFVGMCLELFDQASLTRTAGIEFVEEQEVQPISGAMCQVCGEEINEQMVFCRSCKTPHHHDCWSYMGSCSTYGCRETRCFVPKTARRVRRLAAKSDPGSHRADKSKEP